MSEKTWRVIPPRDETRAFNIIEFIDDDFGTHIAEVYDEDSVNLIAAAPEMYKLLKDCVRVEHPGNYIPAFLELKDKARELLARIDGEEHEELHEAEAQA